MTIGKRIQNRRIELGLSVDELANKMGKNRATVYRYEGDGIKNMSVGVLEEIAKALELTPADLLTETSELNRVELRRDERDLLRYYNQLNDTGKAKAISVMSDMTEIRKYKEDTASSSA